MGIAQSKVTAQGQISIPALVRQKLGIGPGSVLEWAEKGEDIVIRRIGQHTSEDVHRAVFRRRAPAAKSLEELKDGIRRHMKKRYARH
jgi:AbrB family looped-hinge helix DNA binding protein